MVAGMLRVVRILLAFAIVLSVVLLPGSVGAQQADTCDLVDSFGVADPEGLESAIDVAEEQTGVDFVVFAAQELEPGQDFTSATFGGCVEAFNSPGDLADGTVLLALVVDSRDLEFTFGADLENRLEDDADQIFETMIAFFQNGEFGAGLTAGMGAAAQGLETEPANVLGWVAGGVAGTAIIGGGGVALASTRRKNKAQSADAKARFEEASSQVTEVQAHWYDLEQRATIIEGRLAGSSLERLGESQEVAAEASRKLYDEWSPVSDFDADDVAKLADEPRREALAAAGRSLAVITGTKAKVDELEVVLDHYDGAADEMGRIHSTALNRLADGRTAAAARTAEGWNMAAGERRIKEVEMALGHVDPYALRIDVDQMNEVLMPLAKEAESLATDIENLEERRDSTAARRSAVASEVAGQRERLVHSRSMVDRWEMEHARQSFDEVLSHNDEAAKQLVRAAASIQRAEDIGELPRDLGVIRSVTADLDEADAAVDLADVLLDEIDELDVLLDTALRDAPAVVEAAIASVNALVAYESANRFDLPAASEQIAMELLETLREAEAALALTPSDSVGALELAEEIEEDVDESLASFKAKVAERERHRNQALTELRSARVAVDRADRYVDSHMFSGRQSKNGQAQIDEMRLQLGQLASTAPTHPQEAMDGAKAIANIADQIYHDAQARQNNRNRGGSIILGGGTRRSSTRSSRSGRSRSSGRSSSRGRSSSSRRSSSRSRSSSRGRRGKF